jgi:hypothetical protein
VLCCVKKKILFDTYLYLRFLGFYLTMPIDDFPYKWNVMTVQFQLMAMMAKKCVNAMLERIKER